MSISLKTILSFVSPAAARNGTGVPSCSVVRLAAGVDFLSQQGSSAETPSCACLGRLKPCLADQSVNEEEVRLRAVVAATCPEHGSELDLSLNTGLRLGEMYGLRWEDGNIPRRVLTIQRSKNGERRHVPLNEAALGALGEFAKRSDITGPVIRNLEGEPLGGPRHWFEPAIRKAKIRSFSWHCLRHTSASRLVMAGVDIRTVQELMGHKDIKMTVRYSHLAPKHTLEAVQRLSGAVMNASAGTKTDTEPKDSSHVESQYLQ